MNRELKDMQWSNRKVTTKNYSHQIFSNHFMAYDAGTFTVLFVHLRVKECMPMLGKSSRVLWLLVWASTVHFGLSTNNNIFKDNIEVSTAWCSWACSLYEGLTGFCLPRLFMKRKWCWDTSYASFPSLVIIFMGDNTVRQFAVQTVGCSIGAMAFLCASAFLGLNGTVLYKATRNLHTNGLFKRSVLLLVRCLVCGRNFISKVCGHEIAGNNFVSGRMITSGLRLYSKVGLC